MPELKNLEILANLGVAAVVVAMALYMFWKMFNKFTENNREDNLRLLDRHEAERKEWREQEAVKNKEFLDALETHALSTTRALEKIITEIQTKK